MAFDAPSREACTIRRTRTNTPLQALVTLNDPVYVKAAQAVARRMTANELGGSSPRTRAANGVRLCLGRPATDKETDRLVALYEDAKAVYAKDRARALQMATDPLARCRRGQTPWNWRPGRSSPTCC